MIYIDTDVKVRDFRQITGKYRGSAQGDCNINFKLNHKISIQFHNLKCCYSHLIVLELGKFNLKVSIIPTGLETYVSFTFSNKLGFIESF